MWSLNGHFRSSAVCTEVEKGHRTQKKKNIFCSPVDLSGYFQRTNWKQTNFLKLRLKSDDSSKLSGWKRLSLESDISWPLSVITHSGGENTQQMMVFELMRGRNDTEEEERKASMEGKIAGVFRLLLFGAKRKQKHSEGQETRSNCRNSRTPPTLNNSARSFCALGSPVWAGLSLSGRIRASESDERSSDPPRVKNK